MAIAVNLTQLHPAAHATWTGIALLVTTTDTQTWAVDVGTFTRNALRHVADALVADGFDSVQSPEGIVRFIKGDAKIDLLALDGLGADPVETGKGRVVQARVPRKRSNAP